MENLGIGSWLQRRSPKSGTKTAVIAGTRELSYEELAERAARLANAFRDRGVVKGDRVAYLGENDPSFLETLFAAGLLGAVFVPLNTRLAPPEIQFQLRDSGAVLLVHAAALAGLAERGSAETAVRCADRRRRLAGARRGSARRRCRAARGPVPQRRGL